MQYVTIVTLSLIQSHVNDDKIILTLITITHPVTFKTKKDNKRAKFLLKKYLLNTLS